MVAGYLWDAEGDRKWPGARQPYPGLGCHRLRPRRCWSRKQCLAWSSSSYPLPLLLAPLFCRGHSRRGQVNSMPFTPAQIKKQDTNSTVPQTPGPGPWPVGGRAGGRLSRGRQGRKAAPNRCEGSPCTCSLQTTSGGVIHRGQHARGSEGSSRMTKTQTLFSNMHSCVIGGRCEAPGTQKGVWWVWKCHA